MRNRLRALGRGLRLSVHIVSGILAALVVRLSSGRLSPEPVARWWSERLLGILDIRVSVRGEAIVGPQIAVCNHISWLDIPLISAGEQCRFIAKSEIRNWPVAGLLANAAGTFYIRRGKGGARPLLARLVPHLQAGGYVVLFPEGTTTNGQTVLPFHARLFSAAIEAEVPVQPIAIRYGLASDGADIAPFIGDDDLVSHLLRLLRNPSLQAEIIYGPAIPSAGRDRDALARLAHDAVLRALEGGHQAPQRAPTAPPEALAA